MGAELTRTVLLSPYCSFLEEITRMNRIFKAHRLAAPSVSTNVSRSLSGSVYRLFFSNNATYIATVLGVAIVGDYVYSSTFDSLWKINNKGKLFEDMIKTWPKEED
eukprot:TRINITY_DN6159_c0_g1_i2.p1 TRINITY_DN6159_c0_g1~~TRINITY_DN6159_c0_g1_i2.p1  ORF type:complete len:116 (-),score=44.89 TRINITY_DN6159_c0_g1_i2:233-550(-)